MSWLFPTICGIIVIESFLKPLVVFLTQRKIRKYVPILLDSLDPIMPKLIAEYSADEIRTEIINIIFDQGIELDEYDLERLIKTTVENYSFLKNAEKIRQSGR